MYYRAFFLNNDGAVLGEKYIMRYNSKDPEEIQIDYWHPVFLEGEKTQKFKASIDKIHKKSIWDPTPFVTFSFDAKAVHRTKSVYLPKNFEQLYPNLKAGQFYEVECWDEDVNRVVLHLNTQIQ